jgi:hypothetical protein
MLYICPSDEDQQEKHEDPKDIKDKTQNETHDQ